MSKYSKEDWYDACRRVEDMLLPEIPVIYRSRTFAGIIGDIKALPPKKALSLISRKKGLGLQYSYLYLEKGIDKGMGYQACAAEALDFVIGPSKSEIFPGRTIDAGCAVGVTAGILGLDKVTGFDLFADILKTASLIDSCTGRENYYCTADMTKPWPFRESFDTLTCCLVCNHLKDQKNTVSFFESSFSCLKNNGKIVITLPSGSVSNFKWLEQIAFGLENFGFSVDHNLSGLVKSVDDSHSLFWMFLFTGQKTKAKYRGNFFIDQDFGFTMCKTPEKREEKGLKVKQSSLKDRLTRHTKFKLIAMDELREKAGDKFFVHDEVLKL